MERYYYRMNEDGEVYKVDRRATNSPALTSAERKQNLIIILRDVLGYTEERISKYFEENPWKDDREG